MITRKRPNLTKPSDLMATLTLLGVTLTFAVVMRVERLSARNYLDQVRARHYLDTALEQAMEAIDHTMTNCYPDWRHLPPNAKTA